MAPGGTTGPCAYPYSYDSCWVDQGNANVPVLGATVQAEVMFSTGQTQTLTGSVTASDGSSVTFAFSYGGNADSASLPVSYVVPIGTVEGLWDALTSAL
jgi:hypothetical protein